MSKTMELKLNLSVKRIRDLIISCHEYPWSWLRSYEVVDENVLESLPWYGSNYAALIYRDRFDGDRTYRLNASALALGLRVMAEKYPVHFGNWLAEHDDSETGNVFLQCCLFGELKYA